MRWIKNQTRTDAIGEHLKRIDEGIAALDERVVILSKNIENMNYELEKHDEKNSKDMEVYRNTLILSIRNQIREIYVKNLDKKTLTVREHRDIHDYFHTYDEDLHGNGYVKDMFEEMRKWTIVDGK